MRLFALRGANSVERNDADAILASTDSMMRELMERNQLAPEAIVSCIFTLTDDLDAEFPAVAARRLGLDRVPLLCAREVPVPGSMPRVIRALLHYYAPEAHEPRHVYLGEARALRADLESAQ
jgi:chorismate mutase